MLKRISVISVVFFITTLFQPINVSAIELNSEENHSHIEESIGSSTENDVESSDYKNEIEEDITDPNEVLSETTIDTEFSEEETKEDSISGEINYNEELVEDKYEKIYINNDSIPQLAKSIELNSDKIEDFSDGEPIIDNYEVLETKTDDNYEIALAYSDGSYYFVDSADTYSEAMDILVGTPMPMAEGSVIPVIINKNGQVVYSTNAMAYVMNTSNATVNIYTTSSLNSAFTYVNQSYVSDVPLIETTSNAAKIQVAGYTGWVRSNFHDDNLSEIRIVPMNQVINPSYYVAEGGLLYHYISKNLTGTGGTKMAMGPAPNYLAEGVRYFSYDGNYFYNGSNIEAGLNAVVNDLKAGHNNNSINRSNPYYLYYQYLPMRTKTVYTAAELDSYINAKSQSNSKLRGTGQALKSAEEKYGVNALLILGVAINESGWGTSTIAQTKNNLFGIKAFDSNTDAADVFATPGDSIIEFAKNYMSKGYTNPTDWRHYGGLLGNKGVGANVKYASDPFWGEKAARHAFNADLYLSGNNINSLKDTNRYKVGMYTASNTVTNSAGSTLYNVNNTHGWIGATFALVNKEAVSINGQAKYQIYPERNTAINDTSYVGNYDWNSHGYINTSGVKIISDGSNSNSGNNGGNEEIIGTPSVVYSTHIQNVGWQANRKDGEMSGTTNQSLRLEGIKINLANYPGASIRYSTHIQNVGWQAWRYDGAMSGTEAKSLRLEAIKIEATGLPEGLEVQYRVHIQNQGWQAWRSSGEVAGTEGKNLRVEGIEIRIAEKIPTISYQTHVQNLGWQSFVSDGKTAGTEGKSLRLEGIVIKAEDLPAGASIRYRTHIQDIGWQSWKTAGQLSGTEGKSKRLEAIQIELVGAPGYKIEYKTHVQNEGWQAWKSNGATSGTEGKSLRLEGIQIRIVKE